MNVGVKNFLKTKTTPHFNTSAVILLHVYGTIFNEQK